MMAPLVRFFIPSYRTKRELRAERDFLLSRLSYYDHRYDGHRFEASFVGLSSNAMVHAAITGEATPREIDYPPRDRGDMGRCERTFQRAPEHLKPAMAPYLDDFNLRLIAEGK